MPDSDTVRAGGVAAGARGGFMSAALAKLKRLKQQEGCGAGQKFCVGCNQIKQHSDYLHM